MKLSCDGFFGMGMRGRIKLPFLAVGFLLTTLLGVAFSIVGSPDTHAYLTKQCFAIEYKSLAVTTVPKVGATTPQAETVWSTDKICVNDDGTTLRVGKELPSGTTALSYPKLDVNSDNKSIKVTYCKDGSTNKKSCDTAEQNIDFASDRGIKGLAEDTYAFLKTIGVSSGMELQPVTENSEGKDRDTLQAERTNAMEKACKKEGGAQSLGWILCPILSVAGGAASDLYEKIVEPSLRVEPQLFTSDNSNVLAGWQTFQTFANIIFVIILLVVILSQLTGVGIDNYGIKKILPKLIVTAVLINLSYFLCLLAVDVSNILGNGLQGLFDGLGSSLAEGGGPVVTIEGAEYGDTDLETTGMEVLSTGASLTAIGIVIVYLGMSGAIFATPMVIASLLVGLIGVVISMLFLFVLLAARQAAIVVLIVLAPVAVVCYALPNTKKFFDKWLKFFETLLILYPVCGLMVGGGNYVSLLLLSVGGGFFMSLTAMVAGILPIFFIPSVVKSSFAALGSIGGKIAGFGDRMSRGTTSKIRKSETYGRVQDAARKYATSKKAGMASNIAKSKNPNGRVAKFRRAMLGGQAGIRANRNQHYKDELEAVDEKMFGSEDIFNQRLDAAKSSAMSKGFAEQYGNMSKDELEREADSVATWMGDVGGSERMSQLVKAMEAQGMEKSIYGMLEKNGGIGKMSGVMQTLAGSNNKVLRAYGKKGEGEGFASFMGNGGMREYAEAKGTDILDGMDDKALDIINKYSNNQNQILSSSVLSEGQAKLNSKEAVDIMNQMMDKRSDFSPSGEQLAQYNSSSIQKLAARAGQDEQMKNNLSQAVSDIAANPMLSAKLKSDDKELLEHATGITIGGGAGVGASGNGTGGGGDTSELDVPHGKPAGGGSGRSGSGIITDANEAEAIFKEMRRSGQAPLPGGGGASSGGGGASLIIPASSGYSVKSPEERFGSGALAGGPTGGSAGGSVSSPAPSRPSAPMRDNIPTPSQQQNSPVSSASAPTSANSAPISTSVDEHSGGGTSAGDSANSPVTSSEPSWRASATDGMTADEMKAIIAAQDNKFNSGIVKVQNQISGLDKNVKETMNRPQQQNPPTPPASPTPPMPPSK